MNDHTYAGHTLAKIKAAAAASISQSDAIGEPEWYDAWVFSQIDPIGYDAAHIATANPATVLAMAARIEELERKLGRFERMADCGTVQNWIALPDEDKAKWFAQTLKQDGERCKRIRELEAQLNAAILARREAQMETQLARKERNRAGTEARRGMFKLIKDARLEGWQAAREQAAFVASQACLVPPDGGSPTQEEADLCDAAAACIRVMQPPAEWQCSEVAPVCGAAPNVQWKHEDGFGGGLTERNHDGQD